MSTGFNPYAVWLAIDCRSRKPNHYELLGISREEKDPKRIDLAARTQLAKLNSIDPGTRQELLDQVKTELKQAFAVLSSTGRRADYDQQLELYSAPPVVDQSELLPPTRTPMEEAADFCETSISNSPVRPTDTDFLPPQKVSESDLLPPTSAAKAAPKPTPPKAKFVGQRNPNASDLEPPQADEIPEAKLVEESISNAPKLSARPIPAAIPASDVREIHLAEAVACPPDDRSSDLFGLEVNAGSKRRSVRKLVFPAIAGLVSLGLIAGTVYLLGLIGPGKLVADKQPDDNEEQQVVPIIAKSDTNIPEKGISNSEQANGDQESVNPTPGNDPEVQQDSMVEPVVESGEPESTVLEAETSTETDKPNWERPTSVELLERVRQIPISERRRLTQQMILIKNQWLRQNPSGRTSVLLTTASEEVAEELRVLNDAIGETSMRLGEFWQQFRKSCAENRGDIEIDERVVGFVEATQEFLILRIAGSNRPYEYRFVPPGIMMATIDRNTIEDVPTFRLQKAAYLISRLDDRPDLVDEINDLLDASEDDGHDVENLRLVAQFDYWDLSEPSTRQEFQSWVRLEKLESETFDRFEELRNGSPGQARKTVESLLKSGKILDVAAIAGIELEPSNRYLAHLDLLRQLAIQAGDALLVEGVIDLINAQTAQGVQELRYESLLQTADEAGRNNQLAVWYCRAVVRLLREDAESISPTLARKLGNLAIQIAERYSLKAFEIQLRAEMMSDSR